MNRLALALWLMLASIATAGEAIIDGATGRLIAGAEADKPRFPASTTKLMTIYVALEAAALGEVGLNADVQISKHAAKAPPVKLGLKAGETIRLSDAIHAALILSSNDAARAIAEAVSGTEVTFARRMTKMARTIGMLDTTFRNASGLPDNGHVTTAADIGRLILRLDQRHGAYLRRLFRTPMPWRGGTRSPRNGAVASVTGAKLGKTGFTCSAGYTAALLIETDTGLQAIATLANSDPGSRAESLRRLSRGRVAQHAFTPPCFGSKTPKSSGKPSLASLGDWSLTLGVFPEKAEAITRLRRSRSVAPEADRIVATRATRDGFYAMVVAKSRAEARAIQALLADEGVSANMIDRRGRIALGLRAHSDL